VNSRLIAVLLAAASLVACATPAAPSDATGTLVIVASYEEPPPGQPISIGGYGFFVAVDDRAEVEIPFDGSLQLKLPAGAHDLTLVTRPASDMLIVNEEGESEREFYDVTAECADAVEVAAGGEVQVTYHAAGGEDCQVTIDEG
jgi:hypothetical protein